VALQADSIQSGGVDTQMDGHRFNRRDFLGVAGAAASSALLASCGIRFLPAGPARKLAQRELGKTGVKLSVAGFGGMVVKDETPESASELVAQAVARG
jgi:hypothetical protein